MVEAARHQRRKPAPGLVLRLVELHRQIDVADLERAARIGAEDPDLAHPRQVATLAVRDVTEETLDPPRRLRASHMARLKRGERHAALTLPRRLVSMRVSKPVIARRSDRESRVNR
jgi:hypothetical protein